MPSASAHYEMLASLLPTGEVWDLGDGTGALAKLLKGLSTEPSRMDAAGIASLENFLPDSAGATGAYLSDWERVLGISAAGTNGERAGAILARLALRSDPTENNVSSAAFAVRTDSYAYCPYEVFSMGSYMQSQVAGDAARRTVVFFYTGPQSDVIEATFSAFPLPLPGDVRFVVI